MNKQINFVLFYALFCFIYIFPEGSAVKASHRQQHNNSVKLFAFGDSYADTGNWEKPAISWKEPYGITFPGKPAGRFSDGRILTDYLASNLGIKSPEPYQRWKSRKGSRLQFGMNFAYGGTGVFDTLNNAPKMATQINFFQQLLEEKVYTKQDLKFSVAFVSVAGNDYNTYLYKNGALEDMSNFTASLIKQLSTNLKRIHGLGVQKVAVTSLQPIGCLPELAASSSYQNCSESLNAASEFHNLILQQAVQKLNNESQKHVVYEILDLYSAFMSAFSEARRTAAGSLNYGSPLKPCCRGVSRDYSCGDVDKNGAKKYEVCDNPELSVFWDMVHPSQNGWHLVYLALQPSLHRLS
ncbi:GDSL esterase/lipase At5g03610 [Ricinus communis]|uniref:GDSL esterase/lipase At5g03610 n=1 Tax=Ricinus communis TaxID=3988 RepID=UPI00201AA3AD|nr:GDSL esterase/lipase At5g03610 [Ricinus communis]